MPPLSDVLVILAVNFALCVAGFLVLWRVAVAIRDVSFIDSVWGLGMGGLALATEELADHLVDGGGVGDGADTLDGGDDVVGVLGVGGVVAVDEDDVWADAFGVEDAGAGFDAEGLGFVAGGDERGGVGHGGDDAGGAVAAV